MPPFKYGHFGYPAVSFRGGKSLFNPAQKSAGSKQPKRRLLSFSDWIPKKKTSNGGSCGCNRSTQQNSCKKFYVSFLGVPYLGYFSKTRFWKWQVQRHICISQGWLYVPFSVVRSITLKSTAHEDI